MLPTPAFRTMPTVFIVDGDISVRESLEWLVRRAGWRAETYALARDFLARPRVDTPSCLVLDVSLPDANGLDVQKRIAAERSEMPVILITGHADVPMAVEAMKAGAFEFLTKPLSYDVLSSAISRAFELSEVELALKADGQELGSRYASLSHREREVMTLVVAGRLNKQIGFELGISEITVKAHRGKVMRKMHAESLPDLVYMAAGLRLTPGLHIRYSGASKADGARRLTGLGQAVRTA